MDDAIVVKNLRKEYGDVVAVADLSFSVKRGEVYAFLGPNGAGKTTTMNMLTTLETPTSGEINVAGVPTTDRNAVGQQIGYLPEEPPIYDSLTGREQLHYVRRLRGLPQDHTTELINRYLTEFGLAEAADRLIETYSTGMSRKLGIIQAILHEPEVVILDEPTSGLDPNARRNVRELLTTLTDQGTTVFLSTHILEIAEALSNRVGVLHDGQLVAEDTPSSIIDRRTDTSSLEDVFVELTTQP